MLLIGLTAKRGAIIRPNTPLSSVSQRPTCLGTRTWSFRIVFSHSMHLWHFQTRYFIKLVTFLKACALPRNVPAANDRSEIIGLELSDPSIETGSDRISSNISFQTPSDITKLSRAAQVPPAIQRQPNHRHRINRHEASVLGSFYTRHSSLEQAGSSLMNHYSRQMLFVNGTHPENFVGTQKVPLVSCVRGIEQFFFGRNLPLDRRRVFLFVDFLLSARTPNVAKIPQKSLVLRAPIGRPLTN